MDLKHSSAIYKVPVWETLVLDLVAWVLPAFCLLLLKLEWKSPVKSDAFYPCACFVTNGPKSLLCSWCECAAPLKRSINTEKYHGKEMTHSE